jgi:hypothetical protein
MARAPMFFMKADSRPTVDVSITIRSSVVRR